MARSPDIRVCLFLAVTSLGILAAAFVMQYVFGIEPCVLCTYQRVPYALTTGFALFGAAMPLAPVRRRTVVLICAVIFAAGAALAAYHLGVEQAWWPGSEACTGETAALTLSDMEKALSTKPTVRCDAVPWTLFGLSLTAYNLIASSVLTLLCLMLASEHRLWRERRFYPRG